MNPSKLNVGQHLVGENYVNDPKPKTHVGYNKFQRSYPHVTTARYGDVVPFFVDNVVENDKVPLASVHEVRTPTMVSPFLGDITMKKAYFDVPRRAIYPLNYDLMRVPPTNGDDIPDDNTSYLDFGYFFALREMLENLTSNDFISDKVFVRYLIFMEKHFSRSSLFDVLGYHMSNIFSFRAPRNTVLPINTYSSFDLMFEGIADTFFSNTDEGRYLSITDNVNGNKYLVNSYSGNPSGYTKVSLHYILELLRDNYMQYDIHVITGFDGASPVYGDFGADYVTILEGFHLSFSDDIVVNLERLVAYQLACIEYMTDNHIDSIYSTDLFRNMMKGFVTNISDSFPSFERNGVSLHYDNFSNAVLSHIRYYFKESSFFDYYTDVHSYFLNLYSIRKSLRFEDYFVGGRIRPLAIGDTNVPVVDGNVDAFEMAKSMVYTRYYNAVNLSGSEFDEYSKEVIKNTPPPRTDVPKVIGYTSSSVRGYEVENTTSDNQGNLVTNVRSSDERFAFQVEMDHDAIVLGVCFFEVRRLYSKTGDRHFYHIDRYDMFNNKLQYLGDQDISLAELRVGANIDSPFAYGVRNGEYKQRVGVVSGGVVDFLKSWAMVTDVVDSYDNEVNLNSDYIRSKNVEFDRFFNSSNNSLAGWFHFILKFDNISEPIRPMDVAPNVLL